MKYILKIEVAFSDKYDNSKEYRIGDIVEFDETRAEELLSDPRKLVSLVEKKTTKSRKTKTGTSIV